MNIPRLENRLESNPRSPLFARLASSYLLEGNPEKGVEVCLKGLKYFPDYTTAHLVLGHCYEALGRSVEALLEYRRALKGVPDNRTVRNLLENIERREHQAFQAFAEERVRKLRQKRESVSFEKFLGGDEETAKEVDAGEGTIVTVTLAEIYASQGEYGEAIKVYRRLMSETPRRRSKIAKRVEELIELDKAREMETKG